MNFDFNSDRYCDLPNADLSSYVTLCTAVCAGSVTLNPRERLESNWNENLMLCCWRFSYWCGQSFHSTAIWHRVAVVYIPKYYSAWRHVQEAWSFKNFISLDLTSKLIHNLCSNKIDRGLCGHTVYNLVRCESVITEMGSAIHQRFAVNVIVLNLVLVYIFQL